MALEQLQCAPMGNGIWDSVVLDALTQGAATGLGSHPPREINIANCVLWLKLSLLRLFAVVFRLLTRPCRGTLCCC